MLEVKRLVLGAMQSNCYIAYDTESLQAVIIDPGADADRILNFCDTLGVTVHSIMLTHAHFDHMGAVNKLSESFGCGVIVCKDDAELLGDPVLNLSRQFGTEVTVCLQNVRLVENESITLIGKHFDFIKTPGHTNGSMCIKTDDILFTGDTLFYCSVGNAFPPYGDIEKEIASIKNKLFTLKGDFVCYPGHGRSTTLDFERHNNPYLSGEYNGY